MLNSTRSVPEPNASTSLATASGKAVADVVLAMKESLASLNSRRPALSSAAGLDCPLHNSPFATRAGEPIVVSDQWPTTPTSAEDVFGAGWGGWPLVGHDDRLASPGRKWRIVERAVQSRGARQRGPSAVQRSQRFLHRQHHVGNRLPARRRQ